MSSPYAPRLFEQVPIPGGAVCLLLVDDVLYVAAGTGGVWGFSATEVSH